MALAREVHPREVLVERDRDVRIGLVVAQPDVEAGLYCLMKFCSASSASASLLTTSASICSIMSSRSRPPRVLGLEKWDATRLRIDTALPT